MRRGAKPAKAKNEPELALVRKSLKSEASRRRQLEKRLAEALEQQTATGEILRVISSSPTDAQPVFDTIARSAMRLSEGGFAVVSRYDGDLMHLAAHAHARPEGVDFMRQMFPMRPGRINMVGRAILTGAVVHAPDVRADPEYNQTFSQTLGNRSSIAVPMLRDGQAIGAIMVGRLAVRPFSQTHIALLQTFAAQAVIAIENVRLFTELEARNGELTETLEQQTATSEILRVISSSPTDVQPVFDTIVASAARLCNAFQGEVFRFDGELIHFVAQHNSTPEGLEIARRLFPARPHRGSATGRSILDRAVVHIPDVQEDPEYRSQEWMSALGARSVLSVPMLRDGSPIGTITLSRVEPGPFPDRQVALLKTFADQAVIAIENVGLFTELQARNGELTEALEQQTATGEILRVISGSPTDVQPVFEAIARSATALCEATNSGVFRFDGRLIHLVAHHNWTPQALDAVRQVFPIAPGRGSATARAILNRAVVHIPDLAEDPEFTAAPIVEAGFRSEVSVPMLRDDQPIGAIIVTRMERRPFSAKQIALLQTFAAQAVIAVENVRLFQELEARNRELTETLEQQTATGEILRVISSSPTDVQPVFDTIAQSATRLCEAQFCTVFRFDGELLHFVAHHGWERLEALRRAWPMAPDRGSAAGRSVLSAAVEHIPDIHADPDYTLGAVSPDRSIVAVPMLREGNPIGAIAVARAEAGPFSVKQIDLLKTFADQAVIAVENVRLFTELGARNRELTETLEQQTATGEILRAISSSPTDVQPVFDTIAQNAARLCEAQSCEVFRFDGELLHFVAHDGLTPEGVEAVRRAWPMAPSSGSTAGRSVLNRGVAYIPDVHADPDYMLGVVAAAATYRSTLAVPMLREGVPIGTITVSRSRAGLFPNGQIELLKTFADQAVIAIENVRLFQELEAKNRDLTETLEQQTATSEILRVISSSLTDVQPVFDTIAQSAARLCEAQFCFVFRFDGQLLHFVAHSGLTAEGVEALRRAWPMAPSRGTAAGRSVIGGIAHIPDVHAEPGYAHGTVAEVATFRSVVAVPMMRDGVPIGTITLNRSQAGLFPDRQIELLKTFADQAVIAVENVRLFQELEARNHDLTETLEQQTATGEILRVISSSPTDVQPVFDTIVRNARRLCEADSAGVLTYDGALVQLESIDNANPERTGALRQAYPMPATRGHATGRAILTGRPVHIPDVREDPDYALDALRDAGLRSLLSVPMVRDGIPIGAITVQKWVTPRPFSDNQIGLLKTFADQAVIAIENVRLFQELEARTRDLTRSVGELQALGEVSQAVSSTLDLETVLATIVSRAVQLSGSHSGIVYEFDEATQSFHARATHQISPEHLEAVRASPIRLGEGAVGHAGVVREPVQVADIEDERQLVAPQVRALLARDGTRSLLAVPLVREGRLLGGLVIIRRERGAFSPDVVTTLQTFATQSVLAIHNARLFREIQRQKQYADALVDTSPVAIGTMDLRDTIMGWNPAAERLFGYTSGEAIGRQLDDLIATTPELRDELRAYTRQTLGGERIHAITRRARKDGTLVDVEVSSVLVAVAGADVGYIAIYHDITELLRARREAEAANEAKGAFLATMSHEIRTPMNAVIGMSGLLLNTALTDEQREYAEIVRQSGDALLTVINDILDFSKIEAGKLELESQPFELRECVEAALDLVAPRAAEKGLDLAYVIGDGVPAAIVGDVTRLRQVLLNLLSNAVKFTGTGEVVLSVSARRLDDTGPLHELIFSVRDTGIGIPSDRLGRLFQSFSQVDASTTRRYGGTGLGLAISQRLTELMGGRISVTSEVGTGSEFRVTIRAPAAEGPLPGRRDLGQVQPTLRGTRVLVVDDNDTNRRILTAQMTVWGMRSRATGAPREALEWIGAGELFDVAILDMHMPEMDGLGLARAIRALRPPAELALVLYTSLGRREAGTEDVDFAAVLTKPVKPSQLFDALVGIVAEQPTHGPVRAPARTEFDPETGRRHPLRILLAEDNVVNQKVALRLLGQMGYRADLAANGLEAIEALERQAYDVVLMDVQMPEMDGFEASREINRRWPGALHPRLVAMTANAMQGDRELCLAAGMDDYVSKPIRVEELVVALARCQPSVASGPGGAPAPPAGRKPEPRGMPAHAVIDPAALEQLRATVGAGFMGELIATFEADGRELLAAMRRALPARDVDAFRRAAHSLKSNAASFGATALAAAARDLESMARTGSLGEAEARLEPLATGYEAAIRALKTLEGGGVS